MSLARQDSDANSWLAALVIESGLGLAFRRNRGGREPGAGNNSAPVAARDQIPLDAQPWIVLAHEDRQDALGRRTTPGR